MEGKYDLSSNDDCDAALRTGDYKARMIVGKQPVTDNPLPAYETYYTNTYELQFPDGKTRTYSVVGESE